MLRLEAGEAGEAREARGAGEAGGAGEVQAQEIRVYLNSISQTPLLQYHATTHPDSSDPDESQLAHECRHLVSWLLYALGVSANAIALTAKAWQSRLSLQCIGLSLYCSFSV